MDSARSRRQDRPVLRLQGQGGGGGFLGLVVRPVPDGAAVLPGHVREIQGSRGRGIRWNQLGKSQDSRGAPRDRKRFVEANHYTFPVLIDDHDHSAVEAYQIEGFPTVFLIDKTGRIRYKNVGFTREIDQILSAQIESLME